MASAPRGHQGRAGSLRPFVGEVAHLPLRARHGLPPIGEEPSPDRCKGLALAILALLVLAWDASAQPVEVPATWGGPLPEQPRLTGSWFDVRDEMGRRGVVLDLDLLQTPQGVANGGREEVASYGGLAEYTLNVDTQKLGLWPGGFLSVQGMTSFAQNVGTDSGAIIPPSMASLLPEPGETNVSGLFNLTFLQFLSEKFGLVVGKISGLGADANDFAHDYHSQFLNTGLYFNMALDLFPLTSYGGGLVVLPWEGATFTASVLDPDGEATNNDMTDAFEHGVLAATEGRVTIEPFGLVGHQLVGFVWSNKRRISLVQDPSNLARLLLRNRFPRLGDPGPILEKFIERFFPGLLVPTQPLNHDDSTWTVYYNFDQYLWSPDGHPDRGIGLFFRFGAADEDTSPVHYAYNVGIGGKGIVPGRPSDQFGIGWSRVDLSGNLVPFLRQQLDLGLEQEDTVELYYDAALTPWLGTTLDLQITNTALEKTLASSASRLRDMGTAVILGLRIYTRF